MKVSAPLSPFSNCRIIHENTLKAFASPKGILQKCHSPGLIEKLVYFLLSSATLIGQYPFNGSILEKFLLPVSLVNYLLG